MAQYLGKFLNILYCTTQTDHVSISNIFQGLAQVNQINNIYQMALERKLKI